MRNHGSHIPFFFLMISVAAGSPGHRGKLLFRLHAQRIVYIHVPVAWFGIIALLGMAISWGVLLAHPQYVVGINGRRDSPNRLAAFYDDYYYRVAPPRAAWEHMLDLGSAIYRGFPVWAMFPGYLILRANLEDPQQNAHFCVVLAVIGRWICR